jgi:hypothetical protein
VGKDTITVKGITYTHLHLWAAANKIAIRQARKWAAQGRIAGAHKLPLGNWAIPIEAEVPKGLKAEALAKAVVLFRKKYLKAVLDWERDPNIRARWTKEDVMGICEWPYLGNWRPLRNALENQVGLILLLPGARSEWGSVARGWTCRTRKADMMWGVSHILNQQKGTALRASETVRKRIAPSDGRYALESQWVQELLGKLNQNADRLMQLASGARANWEDEVLLESLEETGEI